MPWIKANCTPSPKKGSPQGPGWGGKCSGVLKMMLLIHTKISRRCVCVLQLLYISPSVPPVIEVLPLFFSTYIWANVQWRITTDWQWPQQRHLQNTSWSCAFYDINIVFAIMQSFDFVACTFWSCLGVVRCIAACNFLLAWTHQHVCSSCSFEYIWTCIFTSSYPIINTLRIWTGCCKIYCEYELVVVKYIPQALLY